MNASEAFFGSYKIVSFFRRQKERGTVDQGGVSSNSSRRSSAKPPMEDIRNHRDIDELL